MAKERLSKLQKWILERCYKDQVIHRSKVKEFFGKKYSRIGEHKVEFGENWANEDLTKRLKERGEDINDYEFVNYEYKKNWWIYKVRGWKPKESLVITRSEEAVISRSLRGLVKKGLLIQNQKGGKCSLTEKGFLIANKTATCDHIVSFKEYQKKIEKAEQERQRALKKMSEKLSKDMRNMRIKNLEQQRGVIDKLIKALKSKGLKANIGNPGDQALAIKPKKL